MKHKYIDWLSYISIALYTLAAILVSIHRFWQYEVFYYDFGIFDTAIWKVAHFNAPIIDHFVIPGKIIFADHFSPSIFLLSPIYWLTSRPEALLIAQALAVGLSGLVLYVLAKHILKHSFISFAVTTTYLLFVGTQNAVIADIHEVTFMMLPLMLTLYAIIMKRKKLFWIMLLITLGCKESSSILGVTLAIYIYFYNKSWKKIAWAVGALSIMWGLLATQVIIPYFYGQRYFYTPTLSANPLVLLWSFVDEPIKRHTLWLSFSSFGFLPVFYPPSWLLIIQDVATRFLQEDFTLRWGTGLHYSAQLAVIMAFSSIMAINSLHKYVKIKSFFLLISITLLGTSLYLHQFKLHGPLGLAYNPAFYRNSSNFLFLDDLISRVPKNTTVMTSNNIAPHMIHTHNVFLLRDVYTDFMPEYFVLDLRGGQNGNNFFGVKIDALMTTLQKDVRYEIVYQTNEQRIYKRK